MGYVTVTFGSSQLPDPKMGSLWKNQEAEKYDKAMKDFQHATRATQKKQELGTAKKYYKSITDKPKGLGRVKHDVGYFVMFSGRGESGGDDGGSQWSVGGAAGFEIIISADYTQQMQVGPVPLYLNFNFSASVGFSFDVLHFSFGFDRDANLSYFDWYLARGFTVEIRLALTVSLGIGSFDVELWLMENGREKQKIETLHADCLVPANSRLVLHTGGRDETVATGEAAFFRLKDFEYSPRQPESVTAQAGEDVSFDLEAAGGTKPYRYQWQVYDPKTGKWVDLKGFTESTIRREKIEAKWDGARFRCVVTDAAGATVVSDIATLTVRAAVDTGDHSNLPLYLAVAFVALALLLLLRRRAKQARE